MTTLLRIDELYAFIASDADGEGLPSFRTGRLMMPMVCADKARVDSLRGMAAAMVRPDGQQNHPRALFRARGSGGFRMIAEMRRSVDEFDREAVRAWIEDATGEGLSVADPLPDTLVATAQSLNLHPVELKIWIYTFHHHYATVADWAPEPGLAEWAAARSHALAVCAHCGQAVVDTATHECPPKEAA